MDTWTIVKSYLQENGLVKSQIDSFNIFVSERISAIIEEVGSIKLDDWELKFKNFGLTKPVHTEINGLITLLHPKEARLRNITYSSNIYVDISIKKGEKVEEFKNCFLGKLPIMVGSNYCNLKTDNNGECKLDPGSYFIVSGSEKIVIAQEKMNNNQVYVFNKKQGNKQVWEAEIRSLPEMESRSTSTLKLILTPSNNDFKQYLRLELPFLKSEIPGLLIFKYFNKDPKDYILCKDPRVDDLLHFSQKELNKALEPFENDIIKYLSKKCTYRDDTEFIEQQMIKNFLPHMGDDPEDKCMLYGYIINQVILCHLNYKNEDDRDHYKNKRIDLVGFLMASLFRQLYKKMHKDLQNSIAKIQENNKVLNLSSLLKTKIITNGLKFALATGTWGVGGTNQHIRSGVSQVLNRHSYMSTLSHMRRINSPIGKEGKMTTPRHLHGSHAFRICPSETPEGQACGLVKNMALTNMVTIGTPSKPIKELIYQIGVDKVYTKECYVVFVNGYMMGYKKDSLELVKLLKNFRKNADIAQDTGIAYDNVRREIRIHTDPGRCTRPLLVVKENELLINEEILEKLKNNKMNYNDLVRYGYIEYIDADEEETCLIAFDENDLNERKSVDMEFTHCEMHPAMMLGITASNIPFAEHNQAPRVVYQSAMSKQAMGIYATNFNDRIDSYGHLLFYPQKPLVRTNTAATLGYDNLPSGINCIVAIACYTGFNQEDSVIVNKSAIDRGLFRSMFIRTYKDEINQVAGSCKETMENPAKSMDKGLKFGSYKYLDEDGLANPGIKVKSNDIIIGKTVGQDENKKDISTTIRSGEQGTIDKVMLTVNEQGMNLVKTKIRTICIPEIGDKLASAYAQKGTIGMVLGHEDMPFTEEGIVPDIIINPHCIPSRMTVGQLIECIYGKYCAVTGEFGDGTAFTNPDPDLIADMLEKIGYERNGTEVMYNGMTGEKLDAKIFIGPTYYQRLKHLVKFKIHSRATGPLQILTRQPVEGRSKDGGLRFGRYSSCRKVIVQTMASLRCGRQHIQIAGITC